MRAILVGAGHAGRHWLQVVRASSDVRLAAVVDVDVAAAQRAVDALGLGDVPVATRLADVVPLCDADFVIDVTVPEAHLPVTLEALAWGLPVLGEKPVAASVPEALLLVAASELAGELFMVSQSRRYHQHFADFKAHVHGLGPVGIVTTEFFRADRLGGFREVMDHPLLLDMAIHAFDGVRYLLDAEPVSVYCEEYSPSWSWYAGDAATTAIFEMSGGQRYIYTGSWCSPGLETSWNGSWHVSAKRGSARWDGDNPPEVAMGEGAPHPNGQPSSVPGEGIAGALASFVDALRTGRRPMGEVHENVISLAMVAAAVESSSTRTRVRLDALLQHSMEIALDKASPPVREVLRSWTSLADVLHTPAAVVPYGGSPGGVSLATQSPKC